MARQQDAYDAHQLARFMRPDAARWIRPDAVRFLKSGTSLRDAFPGAPGLEKKYSPDQPRDDRGRWTDGGGLGSVLRDDLRVISDTDSDAVRSDQQYAQNRSRGGGRVIIGGQQFELTPAQGARLSAVQARAEEAIARVQEIDPNWRPQPSVYETPEGLIRAYETDAAAAQARANYLAANRALPGPIQGILGPLADLVATLPPKSVQKLIELVPKPVATLAVPKIPAQEAAILSSTTSLPIY